MATVTKVKRRQGPWRLTVEKYLRMFDVGILTEKDRVFLWKGVVLKKMTKGRPHTLTFLRLLAALQRVVIGHPYYIEPEQPVTLTQRKDTLPEPDLMVVRGRAEDYLDTPTTRDLALIVEVADSSLPFDMGETQRLYAVESVPEYWVASVSGRWVEVFTQPSGPQSPTGYRVRKTYRAGDSIPVQLDGNLVGYIPVDEYFA